MFQSTPPAWGATLSYVTNANLNAFQSTPPAWGATMDSAPYDINKMFQSTPPAWGATVDTSGKVGIVLVSIHAPRVGGDAPTLAYR